MGQDSEPAYIFPQKKAEEAGKKVARYWTKRWLTSRINYAPALEAVAQFVPRDEAVSNELKSNDPQTKLDLDE